METFDKLKKILNDLEESGDVNKFADGGKGSTQAGARIRKALQEVKTVAQNYRNEIQGIVNSRKASK
jgi:hypothetical protein